MARFDVYRGQDSLLLDVQADTLPYLKTRLVLPMYPMAQAPTPLVDGLNPIVRLDDEEVVLLTQFAGAVPMRELGRPIGSLAAEEYRIGRALDMLLVGF